MRYNAKMLKGLHLKNFKSWREADVPLAPITGFFGANSSGKSSLLQALLLMKQSTENPDQQQVLFLGGERSLVDLGSFEDLVFNKDRAENLTLALKWLHFVEFDDHEVSWSNLPTYEQISYQCVLRVEENKIIVSQLSYNRDSLSLSNLPDQSIRFVKFNRIFDPSLKLETEVRFRVQVAASSLDNLLFSMSYLGPLRDFPKRDYRWSGAAPSHVGKSGENTIAALLAARASNTQINGKPLEVVISEKLQQLGLIHSFRLEELREGTNIFRVLLRRTPESPEVGLTDVGFGVSQLLPVLVLLYYVPEGSTIILEQPELHLHPSVQSGLADILIAAHKERGVQILLESHSEHLLQRLQRRVAEETLSPQDVALYFCSLEQGESKLTTLELDEYGVIRNYPKDFFGDQFGEIAAASKAALERKIAQKKDNVPA